ncbi:hypothetical protein ACTXT7_015997, partial [Hymenolepis weldensis]
KSQTEDERGTKGSTSKDELDDGLFDEDDEEDDLMRLVRRQKEAYSARVAAGRPSIRRTAAAAAAAVTTTTAIKTPIATSALTPNERLYRKLIRKHIGKAARLRATNRRDKINIARKAATNVNKTFMKKNLPKNAKGTESFQININRMNRLLRDFVSFWSIRNDSIGSRVAHMTGGRDPNSKGDTGSVGSAPAEPVESAAASRRRAERALAEQRRADLELLEARRQQRKLNFLLTQTELYAHFMAKTMNKAVGNTDADTNAAKRVDSGVESILERLQDVPKTTTMATDEESGNPESTLAEAAKAAAGRLGINMEDEFDTEALKAKALSRVQTAIERETQAKLEFGLEVQKPVEVPELDVSKPPSLFKGELKSYQLKGLAWLVTLFDQGINGILADEMGLGKTIQTIAFLGSLAERYNLWGPFLIVTPASTLHNWTQEFAKFMPDFRIVPYWGGPAERKILRRFWSPTAAGSYGNGGLLGTRDAAFHVVVTSYQFVLQDSKFINKTAWTYIVLDEAHAIKSTSSLRWKNLLSFKCRNRLLLTGTPIQNRMCELWALLHFIMPALFDSHDEFADWFSKDIESQAAADSSGGVSGAVAELDENQLSRLRLILKPFMLRRVKAEVEHEITEKTEVLIYCPLTRRQTILYDRLKSKIRIEDLNSDDNFSIFSNNNGSQPESNRLMNLVMQLRKVCNHPELFDRRDVRFSCISVRPFEDCGGNSFWWLPKLIFEEGLVCGQTWRCLPSSYDLGPCVDEKASVIYKHFLFSKCLFKKGLVEAYQTPNLPSRVFEITEDRRGFEVEGECRILPMKQLNSRERVVETSVRYPESVYSVAMLPSTLVSSGLHWFSVQDKIELAYVRPLQIFCTHPHILHESAPTNAKLRALPLPPSWSHVSPGYLIADSGKLKELDRLLAKLKREGHRVLIYSQMTKMIDLLEELMMYRSYAYLRLDGSSRLCDRRDMVAQWQTDPHWFVFLLSTRAGGLGINLTAADTVIFYDSDWNPTVDQQAMDRAHRLGQSKPITVYRLISKNTVEGRMLQRAEEKRAMQRMVIAGDNPNKNASGDGTDSFIRPAGDSNKITQSEMVSLLLDDEELAKRLAQRRRNQQSRGRPTISKKIDSKSIFATPAVRKRSSGMGGKFKGSRPKKPRIAE